MTSKTVSMYRDVRLVLVSTKREKSFVPSMPVHATPIVEGDDVVLMREHGHEVLTIGRLNDGALLSPDLRCYMDGTTRVTVLAVDPSPALFQASQDEWRVTWLPIMAFRDSIMPAKPAKPEPRKVARKSGFNMGPTKTVGDSTSAVIEHEGVTLNLRRKRMAEGDLWKIEVLGVAGRNLQMPVCAVAVRSGDKRIGYEYDPGDSVDWRNMSIAEMASITAQFYIANEIVLNRMGNFA